MTKLPFKLDLQFFAEDGGQGGNDQSENSPQEGGQADSGAEQQGEPKSQGKPSPTIPYERFKQVNDDLKAFKETFESLGIGGLDDLKSMVDDYNARKQAEEQRKREEMSELERLQADLKAKEEVGQKLARQLEELQERVKQERITNAFIKAATQHNIAYIDDAIKLADLSAVKVNEDGSVEGVEEVVKALVETKPFLLRKTQIPIGEPSNGGKAGVSEKTAEQQLEEAKNKALKTGRAEDRAAYARLKRELGM